MKHYFKFLIPVFSSVILFSCSHSKFSDYEKNENGLQYKFYVKGKDTTHPQYGSFIKIKMIQRLGDSILQNTNLLKPEGMELPLHQPTFKGAVEEGIRLMAVGDSATFLISTDSVNKYFPAKDSSKNYKKHDYLAFDIKLIQIKSEAQAMQEEEEKFHAYVADRKVKEPAALSQYIQDNHIDVKPASTGMYYVETTKGKGVSPKDGDSVIVHYTGSFLDGTVFDSSVKRNQPFGFVVGEKKVIQGWEDAVKLMKKGTVATIIIPSSLAYDSLGYQNPKTGRFFIQPYSPLKFDIQLLDIKHKK